MFTKENLEILKKLDKSIVSDFEFGGEVRKLFKNDKFVLSNPNDFDLASNTRKILRGEETIK